jgi:outer membrane lipoprotein carrier protein
MFYPATTRRGVILCALPVIVGTYIYSVSVAAEPASQAVDRFFAEVISLSADFEQRQMGEQGGGERVSSGTFLLLRPGRFRWDYTKPYEQLIVGDGEKIWVYDPDLEQVIVKRAEQALGDTPAQLLSSTRPLHESFNITKLDDSQGLVWFGLEPKAPSSNVTFIRLGFDGEELRLMELTDGFGQLTRIRFTNVQRNPALDPSVFRFTPPPGVDVVGE